MRMQKNWAASIIRRSAYMQVRLRGHASEIARAIDAHGPARLDLRSIDYGRFPAEIEAGLGSLTIAGREVKVFQTDDPGEIDWSSVDVDIVIEATGVFTDGVQVRAHLEAGAKKVIITAPATHEDLTVVLGVNDERYDAKWSEDNLVEIEKGWIKKGNSLEEIAAQIDVKRYSKNPHGRMLLGRYTCRKAFRFFMVNLVCSVHKGLT